jgi:hypothetical protein
VVRVRVGVWGLLYVSFVFEQLSYDLLHVNNYCTMLCLIYQTININYIYKIYMNILHYTYITSPSFYCFECFLKMFLSNS